MSDPEIQSLSNSECAATGQDQYKLFDGEHLTARSNENCVYTLMAIKNTAHTVSVSNVKCKDTMELLMCKKIIVTTDYGQVELFQKNITITASGDTIKILPGNYPEPCVFSSLPHTEIFSVGLFTFVQVFSPADRVVPLYVVSTFYILEVTSGQFRFVGNCSPTPPQSQHFALSEK